MKKDITTKETVKKIAEDIAKYIINLKVEDIDFIDKELQRVEKREADIVAKCKIDKQDSILHIEIQNNNDESMPRRMLRYYSDIKMRFPKLDIYQYLIYIGKNRLKMNNFIKDRSLNYSYSIIDMHEVDCEKLIKLDTPDALVLSVLCDFKDKSELEILYRLIKRLNELVGKDQYSFGKYMIILETLSENRDLKDKLKEVEKMLRDIKYENLPSFEIGLEKGKMEGKLEGKMEGKLESAIIAVKEFNLSIDEVSNKFDIPLEILQKSIKH